MSNIQIMRELDICRVILASHYLDRALRSGDHLTAVAIRDRFPRLEVFATRTL